jgi:hypothetical protein
MGSNRHFFIESKAFEFTVDHGGGAFIVRLYERGKDTLQSVFMGKESAITLLAALEELVRMKNTGNFVRTIREGETVFIAQRCSNTKGRYVSLQAIHRGGDEDRLLFLRVGTMGGGGALPWNYDESCIPRQRRATPIGFLCLKRDRKKWVRSRKNPPPP